MGLMLDSSVLIAAERGRFDIDAFIEAEAAMDADFMVAAHAFHRRRPGACCRTIHGIPMQGRNIENQLHNEGFS